MHLRINVDWLVYYKKFAESLFYHYVKIFFIRFTVYWNFRNSMKEDTHYCAAQWAQIPKKVQFREAALFA